MAAGEFGLLAAADAEYFFSVCIVDQMDSTQQFDKAALAWTSTIACLGVKPSLGAIGGFCVFGLVRGAL